MSKQMILHFLRKGVRDEMKTNITRLMLTENNPTPKKFLKFVKIEEYVDRTDQRIDSSTTYFNTTTQPYMMTTAINSSSNTKRPIFMPPTSRINHSIPSPITNSRRSNNQPLEHSNNSIQHRRFNHPIHTSTRPSLPHLLPGLFCGRHNHHTIDCLQRQHHGCFKCGDNDHRVGNCPQIFY
jgi:hypothetical protein